jgi:signal peptidase I
MAANQETPGKLGEAFPAAAEAAVEAKKAPVTTVDKNAKDTKHAEPKDSFREALETIVFVVFLVLLLKAFVAEAFVIPTGSMATSLLGDHCAVTCERCEWKYTVNAQADNRILERVTAICPNCRHEVDIAPVKASGGDKVLVFKSRYDFSRPNRHDVIVFKFPGTPAYLGAMGRLGVHDRHSGPQKDYIAHNYIKRLWGLPGDRLAIWYGDVYQRLGSGEQERMRVLRRRPDQYMVMRRIVNHNDYQDSTLPLPPRWEDQGQTPGWTASNERKIFELNRQELAWLSYRNLLRPEHASAREREIQKHERELQDLESIQSRRAFAPDKEQELRERITRVRTDLKQVQDELKRDYEKAAIPQLITDFLEYNSGYSYNWTPDLMLEFDVQIQEAKGELVLELVGGVDRHRTTFNLSDGVCTLQSNRGGRPLPYVDESGNELPAESSRAETRLKKKGNFNLRFCSFDQRLTVWVDNRLIFGDGLIFPMPAGEERGPRPADLQPARIGAAGASVKVSKLQLYRDVYYTRETQHNADVGFFASGQLSLTASEERELVEREAPRLSSAERQMPLEAQRELIAHRARPEKWAAYYVHVAGKVDGSMPGPMHYPVVHPTYHPGEELGPDEYFALGDNSTQSSDSRAWGQVPERLLLGQAVAVYWPLFSRFGLIR